MDRTARGRVGQNDRGQTTTEKVRPWSGQPLDRGRLKNRTEYRNAGRAEVDRLLKGKGSPYSITERRVPELIPVLGSQPAGDVSHKPGGEYGDMVKIGHAVMELRSRTDRQPHTHTPTDCSNWTTKAIAKTLPLLLPALHIVSNRN